jgi:hypothetical protein
MPKETAPMSDIALVAPRFDWRRFAFVAGPGIVVAFGVFSGIAGIFN